MDAGSVDRKQVFDIGSILLSVLEFIFLLVLINLRRLLFAFVCSRKVESIGRSAMSSTIEYLLDLFV